MHFTFKTCQIVADTSMITQFHEFFECNFWRVFAICPVCATGGVAWDSWCPTTDVFVFFLDKLNISWASKLNPTVATMAFVLDTTTYIVESFQDFLIKLDIKPRTMHLVEIIFSLNNVIVRPTKILNRDDKNWAHLWKIKYSKHQNFQKTFVLKVGLLVQYSSKNLFLEIFDQFSTL